MEVLRQMQALVHQETMINRSLAEIGRPSEIDPAKFPGHFANLGARIKAFPLPPDGHMRGDVIGRRVIAFQLEGDQWAEWAPLDFRLLATYAWQTDYRLLRLRVDMKTPESRGYGQLPSHEVTAVDIYQPKDVAAIAARLAVLEAVVQGAEATLQ